jgi:hypothetical protein
MVHIGVLTFTLRSQRLLARAGRTTGRARAQLAPMMGARAEKL